MWGNRTQTTELRTILVQLEPKLKEDAIGRAAGLEMQCLENGEPGGQSDTKGRKDDVK
jgi:hypothetical protein